MEKQHQEQTGGATPARPKTDWIRPELCRLEAGAAEFGDVSNPDGQPGFS